MKPAVVPSWLQAKSNQLLQISTVPFAFELAEFAAEKLVDILDTSGQILYSGASTLIQGDLYLLGLNPGGCPQAHAKQTIQSSLLDLPYRNTNAYIHENWESRGVGRSPLQKRVVWLLQQLGLKPEQVAASNLIFVRSRRAADINIAQLASLCWPVHEKIIDAIQPRKIVVFGNSSKSPYAFLKEKFGAIEETFPSGHGNWSCRRFSVPGKFSVVGLPHLSRYDIVDKHQVVSWINEQ